MCGIAGLIHKGKTSNIGSEMTSMLQALKHRGPDSTGFAVYGEPSSGDYIMRVKVAEKEDIEKGHGILDKIDARIKELEKRLSDHKAKVKEKRKVTEYAHDILLAMMVILKKWQGILKKLLELRFYLLAMA